MADTTRMAPDRNRMKDVGIAGRFMRATEIDTRLLGMVAALAVIWIGFDIVSGGVFLTPRNLWNLSVQTSSVAVMATGMVLVIVSRNIDLSVGSLLGFLGVVMGAVQARYIPLPDYLGLGFDQPYTWIITLAVGIALGALIGGLQGLIIAFIEIPAFIVTLGGLLVWRGAAWWVASGQTIAPLDSTFQLIGGGALGSIGATWSWIVAAVFCVGIVLSIVNGRAQRRKFAFPLRPMWAEVTLASIGCAAVIGAVAVAVAYPWPVGIARRYAEANNIPWPEEGLFISTGIAIPVLIAIGVAVIMTFVATRTRFGRYVFALGGNPEAAILAGINTRKVTVLIFVAMGMLCAVSAAITTARLNAATNALGVLSELYVIAAAVIGGSSFAGGIGTIPGAVLGALIMQSLQSGMVLLRVDAPLQNIIVGIVLVVAVGIDTVYRRGKR
ncbi:MAG: sugar ABC transporter permease [Hyphomicrobiales bacterium]|nr:sugar ABC transporter permease [Hyphomicrobiales bacterium]